MELNRLALAIFAAQYEAVTIYRQFCKGRNVRPGDVNDWKQIPALPAGAFNEFEVSRLFRLRNERLFFIPSGTTGQMPSRHFHHERSLGLYEASLLPWFERNFLGSHAAPMKLIFLTPENAPNSSLVHMFQTVRR